MLLRIMGCKYKWMCKLLCLWAANIDPQTLMNYELHIFMDLQTFMNYGLQISMGLQTYDLWSPNIDGPANL